MLKNKTPEPVNILKTRQYSNGYKSADAEMVVGGHYWLNRRYVRFIRVTPKGFNFLDEETSRCIFKHHFYAVGYSGIPLPFNKKNFIVRISADIELFKISDAV